MLVAPKYSGSSCKSFAQLYKTASLSFRRKTESSIINSFLDTGFRRHDD